MAFYDTPNHLYFKSLVYGIITENLSNRTITLFHYNVFNKIFPTFFDVWILFSYIHDDYSMKKFWIFFCQISLVIKFCFKIYFLHNFLWVQCKIGVGSKICSKSYLRSVVLQIYVSVNWARQIQFFEFT